MLLFVTVLNFSINIPPLICLTRYLRDHPSGAVASSAGRSELQGYCEANGLTPRERDIIELIMSGKDTREIAKALFISSKTVKNNISKIFQKTHAKSRVQLLSFIEDYRERSRT
jgi:DNA-binding NarL/FixJ family response regulator